VITVALFFHLHLLLQLLYLAPLVDWLSAVGALSLDLTIGVSFVESHPKYLYVNIVAEPVVSNNPPMSTKHDASEVVDGVVAFEAETDVGSPNQSNDAEPHQFSHFDLLELKGQHDANRTSRVEVIIVLASILHDQAWKAGVVPNVTTRWHSNLEQACVYPPKEVNPGESNHKPPGATIEHPFAKENEEENISQKSKNDLEHVGITWVGFEIVKLPLEGILNFVVQTVDAEVLGGTHHCWNEHNKEENNKHDESSCGLAFLFETW